MKAIRAFLFSDRALVRRLLATSVVACLVMTGCQAISTTPPSAPMSTMAINAQLPPYVTIVDGEIVVGVDALAPDWPTPDVMSAPQLVRQAPPLWLLYPGLDLRIPVKVLPATEAVASGDLTPPNSPEGFYVREKGLPGVDSTDLVAIFGHSCVGLIVCIQQDWPFTRFSNRAVLGDAINLVTKNGTVRYTVTHIELVLKTEIGHYLSSFNTQPINCQLIVATSDADAIHVNDYVVIARRDTCQ